MAWDGTKTRMTVDGSGDLALDAGAEWGQYEEGSQDSGLLAWYQLHSEVRVDDSPADTGRIVWLVEINTSEDNIVWVGWKAFHEYGHYYGRYFNLRITVWADASRAQLPVVKRFSLEGYLDGSTYRAGWITSILAAVPANPGVGDRHLLSAPPNQNTIATCVEPVGPTWRYDHPKRGMVLYDRDTDDHYEYTPSDEWVARGPIKLSTGHITIMAPSWNSKDIGTWAAWMASAAGANAYLDGGYVNTSNADTDQITYKLCLKRATYTMLFFHATGPNGGIVKIYKDSVSVPNLLATVDTYAAAATYNVESRTTGIVLTQARLYSLILKVDGHTLPSAGFECRFGYLALWRSA